MLDETNKLNDNTCLEIFLYPLNDINDINNPYYI